MVSGICFKTHSRCIHALLVQLTRKFNKNPPCVFGRVSAQALAGAGGRICSWRGWSPEPGPPRVSALLPHSPHGGIRDKGVMARLQRREGAGVQGSRSKVLAGRDGAPGCPGPQQAWGQKGQRGAEGFVSQVPSRATEWVSKGWAVARRAGRMPWDGSAPTGPAQACLCACGPGGGPSLSWLLAALGSGTPLPGPAGVWRVRQVPPPLVSRLGAPGPGLLPPCPSPTQNGHSSNSTLSRTLTAPHCASVSVCVTRGSGAWSSSSPCSE